MANNPENLTPFTPENQPTPEAKSAGWEKRRDFLYWKKHYEKMPFIKLKELAEEMKKSEKYTARQFKALTYVLKGITDFRYIKDDRDREEGMARQRLEHTGPDGEGIKINFTKDDEKAL